MIEITKERMNELWPKRSNRLWVISHVKDGEKHIAEFINAMKVCDPCHIVIGIDSRTTDKTREIADSLGAITFTFEWKHDFARAKNVMVEHCKTLGLIDGDWIYAAGDDMIMSHKCAIELRSFINETFDDGSFKNWGCQFWVPEYDVLRHARSWWTRFKHRNKFTWSRYRFLCYRHHEFIFWRRIVHEEVYPQVMMLLGVGAFMKLGEHPKWIGGKDAIIHYGHAEDYDKRFSKADYYGGLWKKESVATRTMSRDLELELIHAVADGKLTDISQVIPFINEYRKGHIFEGYGDLSKDIMDQWDRHIGWENGE